MGREAEDLEGYQGVVCPMEAETKANPTGCPFQNKDIKPIPPPKPTKHTCMGS